MTRPLLHRRRRASLATLCLGALALAAGAPGAAAQEITSGTLLVASAELKDPSFARTVILVLRHDDQDGTVGLVLNRPTNLEPAKTFPELASGVGSYEGRLFRGGPIAASRVLILVRGLAAATVDGPEVLDKVFLGIDPAPLADMTRLAAGTDELRIYAGHAAWVAGQLEAEIEAGGWQLLPGTAEIVFDAKPDELWPKLEGRARAANEVVARAASTTVPAQALATLRSFGMRSRSAFK